jgi:KUP system potassium uptake protein
MGMFWRKLSFSSLKDKLGGSEIVKSLGVVFGDIGTSPLYTLSAIFLFLPTTYYNILGVISLIIWTLILVVFLEYAWLAMSLGKKGEGGTIVLKELLVPMLKSPWKVTLVTFLSFIGISLFMGDGVITPAVSILSAVEGLLFIPSFSHFGQGCSLLIIIACLICIFLFAFQKRGTERVGAAFGPLMLLWFSTLLAFGFVCILKYPSILKAISPFYALYFIFQHGWATFFVLAGVILCATGGEALYADMGHLGRRPIIKAWYFVFVSLVINYLGQGAFLLLNQKSTKSVLFAMVFENFSYVYLPFLILSIIATVIASQALISGLFSVVYQGITTNIFPKLKIDYTSSKLRSQVYIGFINWLLLLAVIFMILIFKESDNLASAYGLAVSGTMTLTGIMMTWIFYLRHNKVRFLIASFLTFINVMFFCSTMLKIQNGGYWSIIIGLVPFILILIHTMGQKKLYKSLQPVLLENFLSKYIDVYKNSVKLKGSALFFARDISTIQPYIAQTLFDNNIVYEDNIIVSVVTRDDPFGVIGFFKGTLADGLRIFEIHRGYMEVIDIEKILQNAGIAPQVIFYGLEAIVTKNIFWKIYSVIKRLTPSFVQFYKLPPLKLHGVVTLVEM